MKKINREKDSAKAGNGGLQGGKKKLIAAGIAAVVLICAALVFVRFIGGDTPVALFEDPQKQTAISQILTYPVRVVKTDLKSLPDTIELRIQY